MNPSQEIKVSLGSLIGSFSKIIDYVSPDIKNHHLRVALIAYYIGKEFGLSQSYLDDLLIAACLHDIGLFSIKEKQSLFMELPEKYEPQIHFHGFVAYHFLKKIPEFKRIAKIIKYHHVVWQEAPYTKEREIPVGSYILHLADRIEVLLRHIEKASYFKKEEIVEKIESLSGTFFMPEIVEAFKRVSEKIVFWYDLSYEDVYEIVNSLLPSFSLSFEEFLKISDLIRIIIDYRSRFTAIHTLGVANLAVKIAKIFKFSKYEIDLIRLAGYLHDIGKIVIPIEILEKNGPLTSDEWYVMKSHVYYSYRILEMVKEMKVLKYWAALHHERIDGTGYPFGLKGENLPLGSKIVAVADVFTALAEDRPYRKGMEGKKIKEVLKLMVKEHHLDKFVVEKVLSRFDVLYESLKNVQKAEQEKYQLFQEEITKKELY